MGQFGKACPKPKSRAAERLERLKAEASTKRQVHHAVKVRDGYRCRNCGAHPADVHHLKFRSQGGGDATANLLCLCRICHAEVHAYRLQVTGKDANKMVFFVRPV